MTLLSQPTAGQDCLALCCDNRALTGSSAPTGEPAPTLHTGAYAWGHLDDLRSQAWYARERYRINKARTLGQQSTSPARLRALKHDSEQAEARLRFAEGEEQRARAP